VRTANLGGRLVLVRDGRALDVATASGGMYGPDPQAVFDDWAGFRQWAAAADPAAGSPYDTAELGPPVPRPGQVFAIGLNYREHADEAGYASDSLPSVFTKFRSCLTGPVATVALRGDRCDWEVELVAVIGRHTVDVPAADAWSYVAGLTVGQDVSDRESQLAGEKPQFSLGKSWPGFGPTGPELVTPDELDDPDDLSLGCALDATGEVLQKARTTQMIYGVPRLVEFLSRRCALAPGDLIFTGTPAGVGNARVPRRYLSPGDVLVSTVEGIGELRTTFVAPPA
jgi:2-keto-4-pentenoate hydratase/2-oxohepta-3-ene-1,7-dioic acid hydratase in catechol pathway